MVAKLLVLQEHDVKCLKVERGLEIIPRETAQLERKIDQERVDIESRRKAFQSLEVQRKGFDTQRCAAESQVAKYKTQQLQVKKNEEYAALTKEIEGIELKIGDLEESEIGLLLEMDTEKATLHQFDDEVHHRIQALEGQKQLLEGRQQQFKTEIVDLRAAVDKALSDVDPQYRYAYQQVKKRLKNPPFIVVLKDQRCQGCYLKVSNETVAVVQQGSDIPRCESCGRILYAGD